MAEVRLIKRYANRKLYDTSEKRYVTLDQIAALVRNGEEIKVVDNKSSDDLTSVTLSQILYEQEKKRESGLPKNFLTELVKSSTTLFDYLRKTMSQWLQAAHVSEEAIERHIEDLVKKGQLSVDESRKLRKEVIDRTREYMARVDKNIDERVGQVLKRLNIPFRKDMEDLERRMDEMSARYDRLLEQLDKARTG